MQLRRKVSIKWVLALIFLIIICYILFDNAIRPAIFSLAEAKLRGIANHAIINTVQEVLGNNINYSELINIEKNKAGKITTISANTAKINNLSSNTIITLQDKISNIGQQGISIPIGTLIGGQLFTGRGPSIQIKIEPASSVNTHFLTGFEDAGINQTRHKIFLVIDLSMRIIVGNVVKPVEISSQILIADTIIVGEIPQNYLQFYNIRELQNLVPMLLMDDYTKQNAKQSAFP
jgi:sporulation protein YunB